MTKQEKIVVSAYTGVLMCDFDDLHEYIEDKLGRSVWTHELASEAVSAEIKRVKMNIFEAEAEHFERTMRDILLNYKDDEEACHSRMDDLMCETLEKFGCHEGVKIFREAPKYYS